FWQAFVVRTFFGPLQDAPSQIVGSVWNRAQLFCFCLRLFLLAGGKKRGGLWLSSLRGIPNRPSPVGLAVLRPVIGTPRAAAPPVIAQIVDAIDSCLALTSGCQLRL